ncbi:DUF5071 domain-containing protein [Labrenzia sp. VG12]|uniref:DUF5071 domain-containing protein n=1 Tax=Labrenzia sp. VG12 TaxID=2021862 RepID=UPI0012FDB9A4|nr:DUF5071 domain-containing protein [Labrenzia sp. VG12]
MKPADCVPRDKHDLPAVRRARALGFPGLNAVLPELLQWICDANWPVAPEVADLLSQSGQEIIPHLQRVLHSKDSDWKFWTIDLVIRNLDPDIRQQLRADLELLANRASREDKLNEVDVVSNEVLNL